MNAHPGKAAAPDARLRPILEMDPSACRSLVGVVFDVDDTVTRGGTLEEPAYSALFRLREAGLRAIAVTGRPLGFAELMARMWPVDFAIGENGAGYLRLSARGLEAGYYAPPAERAAHAQLLERLRAHLTDVAPWAQPADDQWARRCDLAYDIGERVRLEAARVEELRVRIEASGARCLISSVHAHAVVGDYDKARGVVRAATEVFGGFDPEHYLFIGDSGNDAAAFSHFSLSAGVANVREHLPRLPTPPRFVSEADRGRGFAEIVRVILERR